MQNLNAAEEDWTLLTSFFPPRWKKLAAETNALKGLRQDKSEENYLRVLLLHFGCGFSLRETVVRAKEAGLADLSDVALLKRLRKSKDWLNALCSALFAEKCIGSEVPEGQPLRLMDSTQVKEPGDTGSLWRIHYSLQWPGLSCDHFKLTATEGAGTAESLSQYPIHRGDHILGDRGYCHPNNFHFAAQHGAYTLIRMNPHAIRLETEGGYTFALLPALRTVRETGRVREWPVHIPGPGAQSLAARLCVIRKDQAAIKLAVKKLRRKASKNGRILTLEPTTLIYAEYVMVLTTFPGKRFPAKLVMEYYRFRWQVELVFKRFKQLAQLGHLPKYDDESAQAWLYGKLFVALLTEKLIAQARDFSPWGYSLQTPPESLA